MREHKRSPHVTTTENNGYPATADPTQAAHLKLLREVSQNLLAVASRRPSKHLDKYVWPPPFELQESGELNAYASIRYQQQENGRWTPQVDAATGRFKPYVVIYGALIDDLIENGDDREDRLAFVVGHELAHILLGHVLPTSVARTATTLTLKTVFTAEQEHDADILGMELALGANYSVQGARKVWLRINSEEFLKKQPEWRNYTSFEGVGIDHPSWTDRLTLIDAGKVPLWKAMSAFENGVFFLNVQQYAAAEECFARVTDKAAFPNSFEAWANLGYARLMQYFDKLDKEDVARFRVGQLSVGSFYERPKTLEAQVTKGVDAGLWEKAITATKRALAMRPDSTLAKANLGVAYLLSPTGRNVPEATRYLEEAAAAAPRDSLLSDRNRAAVLINSAVALLAGDKMAEAATRLSQAGELLKGAGLIPALSYNRALALSRSTAAADRKQAFTLLGGYLESEVPASLWWDGAYALYAKLGAELAEAVKTREELSAAPARLRLVTSVELGPGVLLTLSETLSDVAGKLGAAQPVPAVPGTRLVRLIYPERGLELLAIRRVVAIFLKGAAAPSLQIRGVTPGSPVASVRLGMSESEVFKVMGDDSHELPLSDPEVRYHFYPELGVAVRFNSSRAVEEVALAQPTRRR